MPGTPLRAIDGKMAREFCHLSRNCDRRPIKGKVICVLHITGRLVVVNHGGGGPFTGTIWTDERSAETDHLLILSECLEPGLPYPGVSAHLNPDVL